MNETIRGLVSTLYKLDGKPLILTDSQCELFEIIFKKKYPRVQVMAYTRYGKSLVIALAVLTRIITFPEKWAIVAGREKQARIIISYIIEHTFDNPIIQKKLELDPTENLDRLRRERSKNRLVYKNAKGGYGEVFVLTGDSKNKEQAGNSLMGFGAPNLVGDESSLIDDTVEAKAFRMLGDSMDNFYCKVGNPFIRNHFLKSFLNPDYHKLNFDYEVGLEESKHTEIGYPVRLTREFIEEARKKPQFSVLYENKFPDEEAIDDEGYSSLFTEKEIQNSLVELPEVAWFGERGMGVDIGHGGDFSVWTLRTSNYATRLGKNQEPDLMQTVGTTIRLLREHKVAAENVFLDDTGIGGGVTARIREQRLNVKPVVVGEKADDFTHYENRRAENFWRLKQWLNQGGKLNAKQDWSELLGVKYRANDSTGRLMIMPKEKMRSRGLHSPDEADSLMLSFDRAFYSPVAEELQRRQEMRDFDPFKSF